MRAATPRADTPVFFDQRGRRWKRLRLLGLAVLAAVLGASALLLPAELGHEPLTGYNPATASVHNELGSYDPHVAPYQLADDLGKTELPVIGSADGPFAEVVHLTYAGSSARATPLYHRGVVYPLNATDIAAVGRSNYAILRYGQVPSHELAVTFDDGPDARWTPAILDLLAREHAPATFFQIGAEVAKHPAVAQRVAKEGHVIGSHTFDHVDFDYISQNRADQELNQTQHVIRAVSGYQTSYIRLPYAGDDPQGLRDSMTGILESERFGYTVTYFEFDSQDWTFPLDKNPYLRDQLTKYPSFDGAGRIVLMHDGGGDRSKTLPYLAKLIDMARAHGYQIVNLNQMFPQQPALFAPTHTTLADRVALMGSQAYFVWPNQLVGKLFYVAAISLIVGVVLNLILAVINVRREKRRSKARAAMRSHPSHAEYEPAVSVIVPAYKEEAVIERTVISLLESDYADLEVIVVDDGSPDGTYAVASRLAEADDRVAAYTKENAGKAEALNLGIDMAEGEIVIAIDADTIFPPDTVGRLVRHFADRSVGAVAGSVKVGNVLNSVTRWQALDYSIGINLERNAQALLRAVMIVPGACGAWRRSVLKEVGGFPRNTLAEDFDLALCVHEAGYQVLQDTSAYGLTEAPLKLTSLIKQRSRWIFGHFQVYWKHRRTVFRRRHGWLGCFFMPMAMINLALPIVFVPLLVVVDIQNIVAGHWQIVAAFFALTIAVQFLISMAGIALGREKRSYLLAVPFTRLVYMPVRTALLYHSVLRALKGAHFGWNKLHRTATVLLPRRRSHERGTPARLVRAVALFVGLPLLAAGAVTYEVALPAHIGNDYLNRLYATANALIASDRRLTATQSAPVFNSPDTSIAEDEADLGAILAQIRSTKAQLVTFRQTYNHFVALPGAWAFGTYHQAVVQHTLASRLDGQSVATIDAYEQVVSYLQHYFVYEAAMLNISHFVDSAGELRSLSSGVLSDYQAALGAAAFDLAKRPVPAALAPLPQTAAPMFARTSQALGQLVQGLKSGSDGELTNGANAFDGQVAVDDSTTRDLPADLTNASYTATAVSELPDKVNNLSVEGGGSSTPRKPS